MPGKEITGLGNSDPKAHVDQGKDLAADFIALLLQVLQSDQITVA